MKKLEKLTLKELSNVTHALHPNEASVLCGGSGYYQMAGGVFVNYNGYGVYIANNGSQTVFDGVNVNGCTACWPNSAYQLNGGINVSSSWGSDFTISDLRHEYGHYLQQQEMGTANYLANVALPSMISANSPNHSTQSYETDATIRGNAYY